MKRNVVSMQHKLSKFGYVWEVTSKTLALKPPSKTAQNKPMVRFVKCFCCWRDHYFQSFNCGAWMFASQSRVYRL